MSVVAPRYPWWVGVTALEGAGVGELLAVHDALVARAQAAVDAAVGSIAAAGVPVTDRS